VGIGDFVLLYLILSLWCCRCAVLTVDIEHVDVATMEKLEQQGVDCQPKASTIRIIQVCAF
jgi:phosphoribosylaminoimidazole carboxylase